MELKIVSDKPIVRRSPLIYLPLLSSLFSNLIYGLAGGQENSFSYIVTILLFLHIATYFGKVRVNTNVLILFFLVSISFIFRTFNLDYGNENIGIGLLHGFQVCVKILIIAIIYPEVKKLSSLEIEIIFKDFVKILIFVIVFSMPLFILASNELIHLSKRFIAVAEVESYRYGGLGFETLDFAYCAIVGLLLILSETKIKSTKRILLFLMVGASLYLTKSNFMGVALGSIFLFVFTHWAMNGSVYKKLIYFVSILLMTLILLNMNTVILGLFFSRFSELEVGTSLGERILPGLNLLNHYFNNFGYLKLPAPGISIAEIINNSTNYISFNAWGLSKVLTDFGILGIPAVILLFFIGSRFLRDAYGNLLINSVGIVSLAYIFAQAGYMNYTAITLLMLTFRHNKIRKSNNI
jgi:hypothetical protein